MNRAAKETGALLRLHAARYPVMEPQDAVKLLYQGEFGGGHLIADPAGSLKHLREESLTAVADAPLFENVGGCCCRVYLGPAGRGEAAVMAVHRMFLAGSARLQGSAVGLEEKLAVLSALTAEGALPFSAGELAAYLEEYRARGLPAVSHSAVYRKTYGPAYRVVPKEFAVYFPLLKEIEARLMEQDRVTVALDGLCGSGKTTLAAALAAMYDCNIIPLDAFFLPPDKRTPQRLGEPGGNIDYERFAQEVVPHLGRGEAFTYRVFDCGELAFTEERTVEPRPLIVCEGSYSRHPGFGEPYDLKVFVTCTEEEQKRRLLDRSGPALFERFLREWIPMEQAYFNTFRIQATSDLIIDTTPQSPSPDT